MKVIDFIKSVPEKELVMFFYFNRRDLSSMKKIKARLNDEMTSDEIADIRQYTTKAGGDLK